MYPGEQVYRFYYGCSLAFEGRVQEAIRDLARIPMDKDLTLGSTLALLYSHRRCQVVDQETITNLEIKLKEIRKNPTEMVCYKFSSVSI